MRSVHRSRRGFDVVDIYHPPGVLREFLNEFGTLTSSLPDDGSPLFILGDFHFPMSAFDSILSNSLIPLLASFDLTLSQSPPTHKAGNTLDLIFTRGCSPTSLIAPPPSLLVSDYCDYFVSFSVSLSSNSSHSAPTQMVMCHRNLRLHSASPTLLSSFSASCDSHFLPAGLPLLLHG
ncbi:unnamed protein product [Oncorhynchus mykiss]|uniref:Endonuclease/exonuclease/phosphatase domain-containing protein n=1 Tax=Oncorhynchus mykiss TaxID=8022 RepID=A0A060YVF0_ONCMY|nr:unnamed protein product [Oncorhynchus mykiss]